MKKRVTAFWLAMMLLFTTVFAMAEPAAVAKAEQTVTIHYARFDENYDGWNLWVWGEGKEGAAYDFDDKDDYGAVAHITLKGADDVDRIGFIVRKGDWEAKDVESDRFIEVADFDGSIEIWLVSGDEQIYTSPGKVDMTPAILSAYFVSDKEIDVNVNIPADMGNPEDTAGYVLADSDGAEYPLLKRWTASGASEASSFALILKERVDISKQYTLSIDGYGSILVSVQDAYANDDFNEKYYYDGDDLGAICQKDKTDFRVWAPVASKVVLNLYEAGDGDCLIRSVDMEQDVNGTWVTTIDEDLNGTYYTYSVTNGDNTEEAVDPYARTTGVNGGRGMVIDLDSTDPENWDADAKPAFQNMTDAVIYELHIRDFTIDPSSGVSEANRGKYLGLTELDTVNASGEATGLSYLKDLGITHVHILPSYDFASVDETGKTGDAYNWGYDPENYNAPEGSYSTDPYHGEVRVNEYKQMVQALHDQNIRVVMDVVYNHTFTAVESNLNKIVPNYYYHMKNGKYSNGSGCGNELASDRSMVRKYIIDSVAYWAKEYNLDGFRFDLMGVFDIETMNEISSTLKAIDPSILIYGEGWSGGEAYLDESIRATKANTKKLDQIAAFSDDMRDGLKGSVFEDLDTGFVSGKEGKEYIIQSGIVASTTHDQVKYAGGDWAGSPQQCINYISCHDNLTFWDKLATSNADESEEMRSSRYRLAAATVMTSQGIPFFLSGEEIRRTKAYVTETGENAFDHNSYNSGDEVNAIKWDTLGENQDMYSYYKGLISFRKNHSGLRMTATEEVQKNLSFLSDLPEQMIGFTITGHPNGEVSDKIMVLLNGSEEPKNIPLPDGEWDIYINGVKAGTEVLDTVSGAADVEPLSAMVLVQGKGTAPAQSMPGAGASTPLASSNSTGALSTILLGAGLMLLAAAFVSWKGRKW